MARKTSARDPLSLACEHVGRFLYHFARVEMQLDAALTTVFKLDPRYAPIITGNIDFIRKVTFVEKAVELHNESRSKKNKIKMGTFSDVRGVNQPHRVTIAHKSFEPDGADAVQFGPSTPRGPRWTKQQFEQQCRKLQRLEIKLAKIVSEIEGEQFSPKDLMPWLSWSPPDYRPDHDLPGLLTALLDPRPLEELAKKPRPPLGLLAHPPPTLEKK
jgi:hypothetical protein